MSNLVIVRDDGFHDDDLRDQTFNSLQDFKHGGHGLKHLHLENDADPIEVEEFLGTIKTIRIPFPNFTDGRGFSQAARIRFMGFCGRLRAQGHIIADQYQLARRNGFDEIAIDAALAARQPQNHWQARREWRQNSYQRHLLKSR